MKKLLSTCMALILLLNLLSVATFATSPEAITMSKDKSDPLSVGDSVVITITIPAISEKLASAKVQLNFDKNAFELTATTGAPLPCTGDANWFTGVNIAGANTKGYVGWSDSTQMGSNALDCSSVRTLTATFKVKDTASTGDYTFALDTTSTGFFTLDQTDGTTKTKDTSDFVTLPSAVTVSVIQKISTDLPISITKPLKGDTPQGSISATKQYTGAITWEGNPITFAADTKYTAKVELTAKTGYQFANGVNPIVAGSDSVTDVNVKDSGSKLEFKVTFPKTADKDALPAGASVSITGMTKIGQPLTATTSGFPTGAGTLSYKWYRDGDATPISGADSDTYTPNDAADVGKKIKVEVSAANYSNFVTNTTTDTVKKAAGPAAPTGLLAEVSKTDTTITVTANAAWEYSIDNGSNWQDSNVFTGLTANTTYSQIVARVKTTDTHEASAACSAISVTTAMGSADAATIAALKATHTAYTGTYDGTAHPAFSSVATLPTGWTSTYSRTETGTYSSTMPQVTNVTDSGEVYVKFSHASYADVIAEYPVTVNRAPLSITAKDHTITYGDAPANSGVTISGFVNGETDAVLTGAKDYGYGSYVQYSDAGNYPIVPKNYVANNYHITFTSGTLKVQPKEVGLTWANHTGRTWGDGKTVTATATGTVNSDAISVTVTGGGETDVGGPYTATATGLTGEKASNYKLPTTATQNYTIGKAAARTLADIPVSQKYTVDTEQSKDIGRAGMPADAGTLTYTKGTTTPTSTVTSWDVDTTGKVTYTLSGGAAGDTVTLPVIIKSINYADSTVNVKITLTNKDTPIVTANDITVTYDGNAIPGSKITGTATFGGTSVPGTWAWKTGMAVTNVADTGTKTVTFNPTDSAAYESVDTNITVTINKATPTGTPTYTAITTSGKTLANANLTVGTITPAGTISWNAGNAQSVAANTAYDWTFRPTDTVNYNNLTGSITPYTVSHSGGGGGGSYTPSYSITVDKTENGTITVSPKSASKGDTVTITVKPDKGYELDTLKVLDKNGDKVKLTEKNGKYTFKMPSGKVTVKGSFVEETPVQIFKDVPVDAYYYEAVKWAAEKGITGGVGNGLFAPNQPCTRAQIVTFLWRAAGSPAPKHMSSFADVPADAFYAKAVAWAVENGITGGTGDGKFSPDATCTRAQSVTFLYRASGSPAVSGSAAFSDVAANAYYADAVKWAEKNGITGGIGGGLFGSGNDCTRAQIVTFLYRNYQSK